MTIEVETSDWKRFFEKINNDFIDWETTVQIISNETGAQILSKGLPLNGLVFDEKSNGGTIELKVGNSVGKHQSHNISEPLKVAFEPNGRGPAGTLDIEDVSGTKTLVTFVQPMPVLIEYSSAESISGEK